ncbi:hypothetical protein L4D06_02390 [Enterovibrio makurazakiensis]|uniref:Uncharacterized protein n=1 Tax=Enterovibrio gelatinilyticus TaxID=2899819 RepID=A0ABT5QZT7_9GAMM|nr:hypothetical protein [Enterovibrio sp. ZSDZ42]MDD1793135.1 hypothetical protein [Enterovibrio sp. ZSDZ42]
MGTANLKALVVMMLVTLSSGCSVPNQTLSVETMAARNSLKDYGLVSCLIAIEPNSLLATDLGHSKRSLSFMGRGKYKLTQDENTFEIIHDPYSETVVFMVKAAEKSVGYMKSGATAKSLGCFKVYHSNVFNEFVAGQDEYIVPLR